MSLIVVKTYKKMEVIMKKKLQKSISFILLLMLFITTLTGCSSGTDVKKTDGEAVEKKIH